MVLAFFLQCLINPTLAVVFIESIFRSAFDHVMIISDNFSRRTPRKRSAMHKSLLSIAKYFSNFLNIYALIWVDRTDNLNIHN